MQIIIRDCLKKFKGKETADQNEMTRFIQVHPFYNSQLLSLESILSKVKSKLGCCSASVDSLPRKRSQQKQAESNPECLLQMNQLSMYFRKENNKQIFSLFEIILKHPAGITYDSLAKRIKTDIITVSHYCCKLKKMRFVDWEHRREGVVVFPKLTETTELKPNFQTDHFDQGYSFQKSFFFKELSMIKNIWMNVSSEDSFKKGGITNQEIKAKIMKYSENKMVRRTVESLQCFEKIAERQGKVFQFKFKNQTAEIKEEINKSIEVAVEIQILDLEIEKWLRQKFTQVCEQPFLLQLINLKFRDYFSSIGVKQSKRQCTPLKLNRYIKVLNYLNRQGGMKESDLRNLIVRDEISFNMGVMHKRSLLGILEGLKNLEIVAHEEGYFYPSWIPVHLKKEDPPNPRSSERKSQPNKKMKKSISIEQQSSDHRAFRKITQSRHRLEIFTALVVCELQKALKKVLRKSFNRIIYVKRKKLAITFYTPQTNILYLLQQKEEDLQEIKSKNLANFYVEMDEFVSTNGLKEQMKEEIEAELIRFIRKNPMKSEEQLRIKYGKSWEEKFEALRRLKMVDFDKGMVQMNPFYEGYLI